MMNRGRSRSSGLAWLLALLTLGVVLLAGVPADALGQSDRSVVWDQIDVTVELREDSSFHVTERDRIDFIGGPFRSGYREIPLARIDAVDNIRAGELTGDSVQPHRYVAPGDFSADVPNTYTSREVGTTLRIEWSFPRTTSQSRTFQIAYDAFGVLRVYDDVETPYQQISWIGVGQEITENAPVNNATLRFVLPRPVDPGRTFIQGPGSDRPEDHTEDGQTWTWTASNLGNGDSLEAGLQFEPLVLATEPSWQEASDAQEQQQAERAAMGGRLNLLFLGVGLLIAIGGGVGALATWWTRGRDPEIGPVAEFVPDPPDSLPPGLIGALMDEQVDQRDIVATLVDLGQRGVLRIDRNEGGGIFGRGGDFTLTALQDEPKVALFERELLEALFGSKVKSGEQVSLSEVKGRFAAAQPQIQRHLYDELVDRGYFTMSPDRTRGRWKSIGVFALIVAIIGGCVAIGSLADIAPAIFLPIGALIVIGLIVVIISRYMPRKSPAGAEAAAKWQAFRNYLASIERYEKLDEAQGIFDRYLPYAIAFGIESSWVDKFSRVPTTSPGWYGGDVMTSPGPFGGRGYRGGWFGPYGGYGGGTVIIPGGGGYGPHAGSGGTGGPSGTGEVSVPSSGDSSFNIPDVQDLSDSAGRSLQASSGSLFDLFNSAGQIFSGGGWSSGSRGGWSGGSSFGGGGGFGGGGFGGGGVGGGGGGWGRRRRRGGRRRWWLQLACRWSDHDRRRRHLSRFWVGPLRGPPGRRDTSALFPLRPSHLPALRCAYAGRHALSRLRGNPLSRRGEPGENTYRRCRRAGGGDRGRDRLGLFSELAVLLGAVARVRHCGDDGAGAEEE